MCWNFILIVYSLCFLQQVVYSVGETRIAVVGVTGSGKSSLCNVITDSTTFRVSGGSSSGTKTCQSATKIRNGQTVKVTDTPGFFDPDMHTRDLHERITSFLDQTSPGPHVAVYVLRAGRYTPQDVEGIQSYIDMFGEEVLRFTVFVFTKLEYGCSEQEYMQDLQPQLRSILEKCQWRYVFLPYPDKTTEMKENIDKLFGIIERMSVSNNNGYYTNEMYRAQQRIMDEKLEEQKRKQIREKEKQKEHARIEAEKQMEAREAALKREREIAEEDRKKQELELQRLKKEADEQKRKQQEQAARAAAIQLQEMHRRQMEWQMEQQRMMFARMRGFR